MLKTILIIVAVLVIAFVGLVLVQPASFRVTRSATFTAPPATVFAQVNDLHRWEQWSPWAKLDPAMKQTYEGPQAGTGATSSWVGNNQVGEGRMTIVDSKPDELVRIKLEFFKPFAGVSDVRFTFRPEGPGTTATWEMEGKNNFMGKAMSLFMNMDKMCGDQFEQGFSNLKTIVEPRTAK